LQQASGLQSTCSKPVDYNQLVASLWITINFKSAVVNKQLKAMLTHPNSVGVSYLVALQLAHFCLVFTAICSPGSQVTLLGRRVE